MKLLPVLVLAALPFYCYAESTPGSGCTVVNQVISQAIDLEVGAEQFIENLREFIPDAEAEEDIIQVKQCFLQQSEETLTNVQVMVDAIYNSVWCKAY
ncbi:mammaglobin-A-like [Saccopteryx bilineata]|uniref:mammaglobin-A-like n=1 Tax=Saccopteryx bilineata TaxID=59482 RepID=UPI00338FECB3